MAYCPYQISSKCDQQFSSWIMWMWIDGCTALCVFISCTSCRECKPTKITVLIYNTEDDSHWTLDMVWELSAPISPTQNILEHKPSCRIVAPWYKRRVSHLLLHTFHRQLQNTCKWLTHVAEVPFLKIHTWANLVSLDFFTVFTWPWWLIYIRWLNYG
jgi:hypothetical protein